MSRDLRLDQQINGEDMTQFMAHLLEQNEAKTLDIERGKLSVNILKQMNVRSRLLLDVSKYEEKATSVNNPLLDVIPIVPPKKPRKK